MKSTQVLAKIVVIGLTVLCAFSCAPAIGKTNASVSASTNGARSSAVEIAKRSVEDRAKRVEARAARSSSSRRIAISINRPSNGRIVVSGRQVTVPVQPIQEVTITKPSKEWQFSIDTSDSMFITRWDESNVRRMLISVVSSPSVPASWVGQAYDDSQDDEQSQIVPIYQVVGEREIAGNQPEAVVLADSDGISEDQSNCQPVLEQVCMASVSFLAGVAGDSSSGEVSVSSDVSSAPATRMASLPARSPQTANTPEPSALLALSGGLITLGAALRSKRK